MKLHDLFKEHSQNDQERFDDIHRMFETIKDNHLAHIQESIHKLEADVGWIKWFLGSVILGLIYIILKG
jgi:hypothetical protein